MSKVTMPAIKGIKKEKVLVIGESYYNEDGSLSSEPLHNVPKIVRKKWLETDKDKKWSIKYYDLIEEFLTEYKIASSLVDVTYYNYVQQLMNKSAGKPKKEDKIINEEAFFQTVGEVEPKFIIVFSISTYNSLPNESKSHDIKFVPRSNLKTKKYIYKSSSSKNYYVHWGYYEIKGNRIPVIGLPHLSRINSQLIGNEVIKEVLGDSGIK